MIEGTMQLEDLLIEDPNYPEIADCLHGIVGITREGLEVIPQDGFEELSGSAQIVAFCLAQWVVHHFDPTKPPHPRKAHVDSKISSPLGKFDNHYLLLVGDDRVGIDVGKMDEAISFVESQRYD